jgi:hypothetical protein
MKQKASKKPLAYADGGPVGVGPAPLPDPLITRGVGPSNASIGRGRPGPTNAQVGRGRAGPSAEDVGMVDADAPGQAGVGYRKGGPVKRAVGGASRPARPGECGT